MEMFQASFSAKLLNISQSSVQSVREKGKTKGQVGTLK